MAGRPWHYPPQRATTGSDGERLGARFYADLSQHWGAWLEADASTGDTDYTWSATPLVTYSFGDRGRFGVEGGYRYLKIDFADNADTDLQMTMSGALLGSRVVL